MVAGSESPGLRRVPRLLRIGQPLPATRTSIEESTAHRSTRDQRRILQCDRNERVIVPSSVDVRYDSSWPTNKNSALTATPDFQARLFSDMDTQPLDSQARLIGDMDTQPAERAPLSRRVVPIQAPPDPS